MKVIPNSPITLQSLSSHRKLAEYYNEGTYSKPQQESEEGDDNQDRSTLINTSFAILCICVAGIGAGLTIGMLSIEPLSLMIKMRCGTPAEVTQAQVLLPIILKRHRLLVTLLLINSLANEALPLFLDKIVPSHVAILLSVTAVLIFGEILPKAIFTGPNQIPLAASMSHLVTTLMAILCPIAWPIAKILDRAMKHDTNSSGISKAYAREEISALVRIMYEEQKRERQHMLNSLLSVGGGSADGNLTSCASTKTKSVGSTTFTMMSLNPFSTSQKQSITTKNGSRQTPAKEDQVVDDNKDELCIISKPSLFAIDEVAMVEGALQLKTKTANDIYTPLSKVSAVEIDTLLDDDTIASIYACGHSRLPVYVPTYDSNGGKTEYISSVTAILLTRQLMLVDSDDQRKVSSLSFFEPICVGSDVSLIDLLNVFKHRGGGAHHALLIENLYDYVVASDRDLHIHITRWPLLSKHNASIGQLDWLKEDFALLTLVAHSNNNIDALHKVLVLSPDSSTRETDSKIDDSLRSLRKKDEASELPLYDAADIEKRQTFLAEGIQTLRAATDSTRLHIYVSPSKIELRESIHCQAYGWETILPSLHSNVF
jgi:metal transporter CNNM